MILTEKQIMKLPIIMEDEDAFYADGEFESILLADFKKEADIIDAKYATNKNKDLDNVVRELHIICQHYNDLYNAVYRHQPSEHFPKLRTEYLETALELIYPIYALMANKTNIYGDAHGMTIEDIKEQCLPSLQELAKMNSLGYIKSAAERLCLYLRSC